MHLDPLDADSARSLLDHLLGDELDEAERGQLLDRSGGNPLFLEEFAAVVGAGGEAGELPDTLRGLVTARLDRLAPPERAMLDNAAVLGSSGPVFALLEFGRALGQAPSRDALTHLMMLDLLDVRDERWSFVSESVREVAYTTLTKAVRARRHVALAQAIERRDAKGLVEQIAAHLASAAELAGDIGDVEGVPRDVADQAVSWLTRAADRAAVAGSPLASARLARRALALLSPGDDRRPELLLAEARGLTDVHRVGEARTLLDEIVAGDAGDRVQASARTLMATIEELFGNFETAARLGDDAVARWRTIGDDAGLAEALRVRGLTSIMDLDPPKAEGFLTESRLLAASAGDRRAVAWADQHLAWLAFVTGDLELADRRIAAAAATFDELGDRGGEGWALGLSAWVRFQEGRFEQAEELATKVRLEAQDRGDRWGTAMMVLLLANLELWRGRSRAAAGLAAQAHATFRSLGDRHSQLLALAPLSRANVAVGDLDSVRRFTEESASLGTQIGNAHLGEVIVAGAEAHAGLGHHHQSLAEFEPIGVSAREAPASWALLALQDGDGERARLLLDHPGARGAYADSVRALALCATGEIDEARRAADAAVIEPGVTYLDVVIASLARACALARAGSTDLALAALVEARVGADATDDKVAQLLVRLAELEVRLAATLPSDDLIWFVDERIADLGADPAGWRRAIRLALGSSVGAVAPDRG
jgi:tetratricopeptide (TPR) repeat protein